MKRKRRTEILVDGDPALRRQLADEIRHSHTVVEISPSQSGLVMLTARESARRSLFHLGEVLTTECRVQIGDAIGLGIIAGDNAQAARDLAVIDAAYRAELAECERWSPTLEAEEQRLTAARAADEARLLETRVRFESMDAD